MPYALFSNDAKLSKAYPTAADVWKIAKKSGLVVDVVSEQDNVAPRPVLDQDYEIRPCQLEPHEDPARNKADAERDAQTNCSWHRRGGSGRIWNEPHPRRAGRARQGHPRRKIGSTGSPRPAMPVPKPG